MYRTISEQKKQNSTLKIIYVILGVLVIVGFFTILNLKDSRDYYRAELFAELNDCEWSSDSFGNYKVCK